MKNNMKIMLAPVATLTMFSGVYAYDLLKPLHPENPVGTETSSDADITCTNVSPLESHYDHSSLPMQPVQPIYIEGFVDFYREHRLEGTGVNGEEQEQTQESDLANPDLARLS